MRVMLMLMSSELMGMSDVHTSVARTASRSAVTRVEGERAGVESAFRFAGPEMLHH